MVTRIVVEEVDSGLDDDMSKVFSNRDVKLRTDKSVNDEYQIMELLGRGKFGEVKKCKEKKSGMVFAAKFLSTPKPEDKKDVEREVEIMKQLKHKRLLQIYDAFSTRREMCLILELITGGELFDRVIHDDFVLTEKACVAFVRQLCEGVQYIHHQNIIHLDLKPENILCMSRTGTNIKIIDFGLAREFDPKVELRVLFGTPEFISPEVVNYDPIDFPSDMWSVGVICYVLLSGLSPFQGDNDAETLSYVTIGKYNFDADEFKEISKEAKDFITKLLVKNLRQRMTAAQCLKHPWLKKDGEQKAIKQLSKRRLKKFVARKKWEKIFNTVVALERMGVQFAMLKRKDVIDQLEPTDDTPHNEPAAKSSTTPSSPKSSQPATTPTRKRVEPPVAPAPTRPTEPRRPPAQPKGLSPSYEPMRPQATLSPEGSVPITEPMMRIKTTSRPKDRKNADASEPRSQLGLLGRLSHLSVREHRRGDFLSVSETYTQGAPVPVVPKTQRQESGGERSKSSLQASAQMYQKICSDYNKRPTNIMSSTGTSRAPECGAFNRGRPNRKT